MKILSFAAILVTVCAVAACSDDGGSGGNGGAGGGGGASSSSTSSVSSSTGTTGTGGNGEGGNGEGGSGEGGSGEGGNGEGGGVDCPTQCFDDNQEGALEFFQLTLDTCGCAEGATCASSCDTTDAETDVCGDDGTGDILVAVQGNEACVDCLDGLPDDDSCIATVEEGCNASEGCTAFANCVAACP
ncbi:hypothetical protein WME89_01480 [Sorangium sp. So ce321]|uniref:hypothetical protein n=1 Tax=Sorangium sp. So ce321 TaxID=3133300 RepID=UPI003F614E5A